MWYRIVGNAKRRIKRSDPSTFSDKNSPTMPIVENTRDRNIEIGKEG